MKKKLHRKESIEVRIDVDGEIGINAVGFTGSDCEEATAFLEEALGLAESRVYKPQFHARSRRRSRTGNVNQQKLQQ